MKISPGTLLDGSFQILEHIGSGGMGDVYRASQMYFKRTVAVKLINQTVQSDSEEWQRLKREAEILSTLKHPNIVAFYKFGLCGTQPYMALEWVDGTPLNDYLFNGPLCITDMLEVARQVCRALEYAHNHQVIHRDLKPSNILVCKNAHNKLQVKLIDFGLARIERPDSSVQKLTQPGMALGTVLYMSPEQCRGETLDQRSDLYSLGIVLFECLTGDCPFRGFSQHEVVQAHLSKEPPRLRNVHRSVLPFLPHLQSLIDTLLSKDQSFRHQRAEEVLEDLLLIQQNKNPRYSPNHRRMSRSERRPKKLIQTISTLLLVLIVSVVTIQIIHQVKHQPSGNLQSTTARDMLRQLNNQAADSRNNVSTRAQYLYKILKTNHVDHTIPSAAVKADLFVQASSELVASDRFDLLLDLLKEDTTEFSELERRQRVALLTEALEKVLETSDSTRPKPHSSAQPVLNDAVSMLNSDVQTTLMQRCSFQTANWCARAIATIAKAQNSSSPTHAQLSSSLKTLRLLQSLLPAVIKKQNPPVGQSDSACRCAISAAISLATALQRSGLFDDAYEVLNGTNENTKLLRDDQLRDLQHLALASAYGELARGINSPSNGRHGTDACSQRVVEHIRALRTATEFDRSQLELRINGRDPSANQRHSIKSCHHKRDTSGVPSSDIFLAVISDAQTRHQVSPELKIELIHQLKSFSSRTIPPHEMGVACAIFEIATNLIDSTTDDVQVGLVATLGAKIKPTNGQEEFLAVRGWQQLAAWLEHSGLAFANAHWEAMAVRASCGINPYDISLAPAPTQQTSAIKSTTIDTNQTIRIQTLNALTDAIKRTRGPDSPLLLRCLFRLMQTRETLDVAIRTDMRAHPDDKSITLKWRQNLLQLAENYKSLDIIEGRIIGPTCADASRYFAGYVKLKILLEPHLNPELVNAAHQRMHLLAAENSAQNVYGRLEIATALAKTSTSAEQLRMIEQVIRDMKMLDGFAYAPRMSLLGEIGNLCVRTGQLDFAMTVVDEVRALALIQSNDAARILPFLVGLSTVQMQNQPSDQADETCALGAELSSVAKERGLRAFFLARRLLNAARHRNWALANTLERELDKSEAHASDHSAYMEAIPAYIAAVHEELDQLRTTKQPASKPSD